MRLWRRSVLLFILVSPVAASAAPPEPPPLEAYGDLPAVEEFRLAPDGRGIATVSRINDQRQLIVVDTSGNIRVRAGVGDTKVWDLYWVGTDRVVVVTSNTQNLGFGFTTDKHEFYGAAIVPIDGSELEIVFKGRGSIADAIFGSYGTRQIDGHWYGYFGGVEYMRGPRGAGDYQFDHGRPALFQVDLERNKPRKIAKSASEGQRKRWLVDGKGNVAATLIVTSSNGKWTIENASGTTIASGVDPTGDVWFVCLNHNGTGAIYGIEVQDGDIRWFDVPLAGGEPSEILANVDVERTYIDPRNGRMLGYLDGESMRPVLYDPAQQQVLEKVYKAFRNFHVTIVDWTPHFSHILALISGNGDSGTYYLVDMTALKADPVAYERPAIMPEMVGPISSVEFRASDGLEMDGILTLPPGREPKNLPIIMFPHGGPHAHDVEAFDWWAQAFASRGYAVFKPNFRGSTNRDDAFRRAGYGEWGRKMQTDISDGLAELVKRGIADPKRACIMGASYGGYAALAGVTLQHGLYRCSVAVAPVSDLNDMYQEDYRASGRDKMLRLNLIESLGDRSKFDEVSPRKHAENTDAPILLIHGKDDTVVPFKHSTRMADALKDAGKPYEFVVLKHEDHWLSSGDTRIQMLEEAMRFILKHNPPD